MKGHTELVDEYIPIPGPKGPGRQIAMNSRPFWGYVVNPRAAWATQ